MDAMRARVIALLALVTAAAAQDPFAPVPPNVFHVGELPYAHVRFTESLALCRQAVQADPADLRALEHAVWLLETFGRETEMVPVVQQALLMRDLERPRFAALRGLLGHLLVQQVMEEGVEGMVVIRWVNGRQEIDRGELSREQRGRLELGVQHLRAAIDAHATDARSRESLAEALETLDAEANVAEVRKLQTEAAALRDRAAQAEPVPEVVALGATVQALRERALLLEQQDPPDHAQALVLRKQALVLDFCDGTIAFEYEPGLYDTVSLLADRGILNSNLTRSYRTKAGDVDYVRPQVFGATAAKRVEMIEGLARDRSPGAAAALLGVLLKGMQPDPVSEAAFQVLRDAAHPAAAENLPRLLLAAHAGTERFVPGWAQRRLVDLAVAWKSAASVPALLRLLPADDDLVTPMGVATALGVLGAPEHAAALLAVAQDPARDVWFRREAVVALGRLDPARLDAVPPEPPLAIAVAAARHRAAPTEATLGRLLNGLTHEHEADDAARYCADLGIEAAIPAIEGALAARKDHYASPVLTEALARLVARSRG